MERAGRDGKEVHFAVGGSLCEGDVEKWRDFKRVVRVDGGR